MTVTPVARGTLFAAPSGKGSSCTLTAPCSAATAVQRLRAGDVLFLRGGVYAYNRDMNVHASGTQAAPIIVESHPGELAIWDGSHLGTDSQAVPSLYGDHIMMRRIEIRRMTAQGIYISGSHNVLAGINAHDNGLSGIHVHHSYDLPYGAKASYNTIVDCTARNNSDAGRSGGVGYANGGNADGISISSGEGNRVIRALADHNSDDGIDTWRSTNTIVQDSVTTANGLADGDGNGFKAGGIAPSRGTIVERSIAYGNKVNGFDFNSGKDVVFRSNTSWRNGSHGFVTGATTKVTNSVSSEDRQATSGAGAFSNNSWQKGGVSFVSRDPASSAFLKVSPGSPSQGLGALG
ncbi:MAG: right-handed parallel beta-helix repeat-containing protein [Kineosporiaceae bacterium]|nr:right-handed parallel beta-helix repeat-containing protein [Kineosporiaceae bacterium]